MRAEVGDDPSPLTRGARASAAQARLAGGARMAVAQAARRGRWAAARLGWAAVLVQGSSGGRRAWAKAVAGQGWASTEEWAEREEGGKRKRKKLFFLFKRV